MDGSSPHKGMYSEVITNYYKTATGRCGPVVIATDINKFLVRLVLLPYLLRDLNYSECATYVDEYTLVDIDR